MDTKNSEDFFLTLVRSLHSLCNGYVKYINEVQVTGKLYISVDAEVTAECLVNEMLRKASSEKVDIITNSFYFQRPPISNASRLPLDKRRDPVKGISTKIQSAGFSDQQNNEKTSCNPENNDISSNCSGTDNAVLEGVKTIVSTQYQEYQADLAMASLKEYNGL